MKTAMQNLGVRLSLMLLAILMIPAMLFAEGLKMKLQERLSSSNIQMIDQADESRPTGEGKDGYYGAQAGSESGEIPSDRKDYAISNLRREPEAAAPVLSSYAIYKTEYSAELEENVVTVKGEALFEIFRRGWTRLPLIRSDVGLIDVSVNKGKAFVVTEGGKYYLMIDNPGRYTLNIEFLIKASREREGGPGLFTFEVIPAPISQFEFTMPETGVEIFVEPAIKVEVDKEADKTVAWAIMPNTTSITTRWTKALPKETITPIELEPKVYVDTATYVSIGEGIVHCSTRLNYSIIQSEVSNLRIALPEDAGLMDVGGNDLRDWKVVSEDGIQYVDVYLNYGIKGTYALDLTYERNIGDGSVVVDIPAVRAVGAEREHGYFGIAARTNVELAVNTLNQVASIDVKELPSSIWHSSSSPILLAFKYIKQPFAISIDVTKHEELPILIAAIDFATYDTLYTEEGKTLTQATYHIRNNVKQFLRLGLPEDAVLWSAFVAGKPVKPARDKNGSILIPLEKSQLQGASLTQFPVEIAYLDKAAAMRTIGVSRMHLPQADIPVSQVNWSVYAPYDYTYFGFSGDMKRVRGSFRQTAVLAGLDTKSEGKSEVYQRYDKIASQVTQQAHVSYGPEADSRGYMSSALPIKIDVPRQGRLLRFSKMIVTEDETPWLGMHYSSIPGKVSGPFKIVFFLFIVVITLKMVQKYKSRK